MQEGAELDAPREGEFEARFEIAGTWDFKWPLGSKIRIAFQELAPAMGIEAAAFEEAKAKIQEHAEQWRLILPATLTFDFSAPDLYPPVDAPELPLARHRSAFSENEAKDRPYDVLISLQDLPVEKFDPFRGQNRETEKIELPVSALGSYARRADYGAPTMYLGRFGHFLKEDFVGYFDQLLVQNIIVHELGHMLGLPHMHQHPQLIRPQGLAADVTERVAQLDRARGDFYKTPADVASLVGGLLGVVATNEVVEDHLLHVWRGNEAFSDWPDIGAQAQQHRESGQLDSIMTFPYYKFTLRGANPCAQCGSSQDLHQQLHGAYRTTPGTLDKQMLALMYNPDYVPEAYVGPS